MDTLSTNKAKIPIALDVFILIRLRHLRKCPEEGEHQYFGDDNGKVDQLLVTLTHLYTSGPFTPTDWLLSANEETQELAPVQTINRESPQHSLLNWHARL
jgi:hypothetical protein